VLGPASILTPPRDGTSLDPQDVERAIIDMNARNPIHTLAMDTSKAEQLASWIEAEIGCVVVDRTQTNTQAALDYSRFTEALRRGQLRHTGHPGLTRHVMNAVARALPGGDTRFERPNQQRRSGEQERKVIDALTAAAMAHTVASSNVPASEILVAYA
jgi:phage terminase large subunit-like protein